MSEDGKTQFLLGQIQATAQGTNENVNALRTEVNTRLNDHEHRLRKVEDDMPLDGEKRLRKLEEEKAGDRWISRGITALISIIAALVVAFVFKKLTGG